jgi:multidrug efflux system outer membrane protein
MTITFRQIPPTFLGVVVTLFLAGCAAVGPTYHPPQPEIPGGWHDPAATISPQADPEFHTWWTLFNDPLLDALIVKATVANRELRRAEAGIRAARAQRIVAAATGSLGTSGLSTHSRRSENSSSSSDETQNLFQLGFDAAWELDLFGGVRRAVEAADASLAASHEDFRAVLVTLQAEVARNYLELRGSQRRRAAAMENIATQEKTVALVRGRYEMGLSNELDLVQAETQLALTRAVVPPLERSIRQAMHQLAILAGQPPASLIPLLTGAATGPVVPPRLPVNLPAETIRQRPDIRAVERRLAAATAEIGVATADLFPKFSLDALLGLRSSSLGDLVTAGSRYWSIGPTLNLSLFDQGKRRAAVKINEARRDELLAEYEQTVLTALAEVEDGLVAFAHEQTTGQILAEAVISGEKAVTIANGLYEAGLTDFLDVLQSERALYQSQDQLAQSDQRLTLAMVAIYKALGGGWQDRETQENGATDGDDRYRTPQQTPPENIPQ